MGEIDAKSVQLALGLLGKQTAIIVGLWLAFCFIIISIFLIYRFMQTRCGRRIKPSPDLGVLITGATSGIGLAVAKHLYKLGFTVFACYFSDQESGYGELMEMASGNYQAIKFKRNKSQERPNLFLIPMDVRSQESVNAAAKKVDSLQNTYGIKLWGVINNAGIAADGPLCLTNPKSIEATIGTNLVGTMLVTREFLLKIVESKGRFVNVSSGLAKFPSKWTSVYIASKSAIASFSRSIDQEIRHVGSRCVCLCPTNLIASTNILLTTLRNFQQSEPLLSDEERKVHSDTIEEYRRWVNGFLDSRSRHNVEEMGVYVQAHGINSSNFLNSQTKFDLTSQSQRPFYLRYFKDPIVRLVIGGGSDLGGMENTRVECSFEDAICLINPPKFLYPGQWFYRNVVGLLTEIFPPALSDVVTEPGRKFFF